MKQEHYFRPFVIEQQPEPVCICGSANATDTVEFCEVCGHYNDFCLACMPEPKCGCVYTDVDQTDAADCQLHDPDSHYNYLVAKAERAVAARRKPAGHEHVAEPFRSILNNQRSA